MLLVSITRWRFSTFVLLPTIVGMLGAGMFPATNAYAKRGGGQPPVADPVHTYPIKTPADARTWGLNSLGNMMSQSDAVGQPLILSVNHGFRVPLPENLDDFVKDRDAALVLGKALFWDMQVGSDGIQACATCHFQAGADVRSKNQVNKQGNRVVNERDGDIRGYFFSAADPDPLFETVFGRTWAPNFQLTGKDFPLVIKQNAYIPVGDSILPDTDAGNRNDVVGSTGVMPAQFAGITPGSPVDNFVPGTQKTMRPVTGRNAPPAVNAVFNLFQFWDGRADTQFNGFNPIGRHDLSHPKYFVNTSTGLDARDLEMELASLASQSTGPPLSDVEMSYAGRLWPDIGVKLLRAGPKGPIQPLAYQRIALTDSVLARYRDFLGYGLRTTYEKLIKAAFKDVLWNGTKWVHLPDGGTTQVSGQAYYDQGNYDYVDPGTAGCYTQMEANFSLFWGIAVMLYEAELVSYQSKFDQWMEGKAKLTSLELDGLNVFVKAGKCVNCHGGPEFTNATVRNTENGKEQIEPIIRADGTPSFYDNGFYNVGMEPTVDDIQRGGKDANDPALPWGNARQFLFQKNGIRNIPFDIVGLPIQKLVERDVNGKVGLFKVDPTAGTDFLVCYDLDGDKKCGLDDEIVIQALDQDGNCKAATIRNVELNGPYFHNGGAATIQQVIDNYDMGGKFRKDPLNRPDMLPDIERLHLADVETPNGNDAETALVAFILALTDNRVKYERAPFDHPDLYVPVDGTAPPLDPSRPIAYFVKNVLNGKLKLIPAVGSFGDGELKPFLNLNPFTQDTGKGVPVESPDSSSP